MVYISKDVMLNRHDSWIYLNFSVPNRLLVDVLYLCTVVTNYLKRIKNGHFLKFVCLAEDLLVVVPVSYDRVIGVPPIKSDKVAVSHAVSS